MPRRPTMPEADQAAELLGIDVFYLGVALRDLAVAKLNTAIGRVRNLEPLEIGEERRILWAAEACDETWAERKRVGEKVEAPA